MSDRYPVSNQQKSSSSGRQQHQAGPLQCAPLKIGHSGNFRGVHTNTNPNQTGYDHMYATDTNNGQPQQRVALSAGSVGADTVTTAISEVHFFKEFLLMHLDLIQQQNEDILHKDNIIIKLQQENALLQQRLQQSLVAQQKSPTVAHGTTGAILAVTAERQTAPGDYSPESIPPTEDILAPDVGDDMTLAEPVAPLTPNLIISNNVTLTAPTPTPATSARVPDQQSVVVCAASGVSASLPEASVQSVSSAANCSSVIRAYSDVVFLENESTDTPVTNELQTKDLVSPRDLSARAEQFSDTVAGPQATITHDHTTNTPIAPHDALCPSTLISTPSPTATIIKTTATYATTVETARYSVVRNSVTSDSGEPNSKNLRMSIRRKRLGSGSSPSNNDFVSVEEGGDVSESKGESSSLSLGSASGKVINRSKRKRLNGHILTFPQEYVTSVGEANVDVLRHQALADEVIKAVNLEVPHWRVKVYADSYHLEGTENLDDEVFLKRHSRLETDERRRKRWDVQRIREQRLVDKLKQRQTKTHQLNTDHGQGKSATNGSGSNTADARPDSLDGHETPASLWPAPEHDLHYIEVTDRLPVGAFGVPLPAIVPKQFAIPWPISDRAHGASGEPPITLHTDSSIERKSGRGRKMGNLTKRRSKR